MRPDLLLEERTRTRAALVIVAVAIFHILLVLLMGLLVVFMGTSVPGFIGGAIFLWVTWRALTMRAPVTDPRRLVDLGEYPGLSVAALAYTSAGAEAAIKKQAMYDAFWMERLYDEMTGGPTRSFDQMWGRMNEACLEYRRWEELWQRLLGATRRPEDPAPTLEERLEALSASRTMPPPAKPPLSPATAILLREP